MALRPALPVAVALGRRRFSAPTLSPATLFHLSRCSYPGIFSTLPLWGRIWLLRAWNGSFSPPWGENRLTGPHRPEKPGAFPQEKTGAAHPRVSLRPSHRLGLAHRAKQAGPGSVLLGAKKPLPGFVGQRPVDCLIHLFSKNVPQCPHKRKAMRSVSWSVTRRKTGFPRMQAPT